MCGRSPSGSRPRARRRRGGRSRGQARGGAAPTTARSAGARAWARHPRRARRRPRARRTAVGAWHPRRAQRWPRTRRSAAATGETQGTRAGRPSLARRRAAGERGAAHPAGLARADRHPSPRPPILQDLRTENRVSVVSACRGGSTGRRGPGQATVVLGGTRPAPSAPRSRCREPAGSDIACAGRDSCRMRGASWPHRAPNRARRNGRGRGEGVAARVRSMERQFNAVARFRS